MYALVYGRTKSDAYRHVCPYCMYCFTKARLLTAHTPDGSVHPEQKVEYPLPDDPEKKKVQSHCKNASSAFGSPRRFRGIPSADRRNEESASNTKVGQLHKPSGFACLRVSQVPEFNGEIVTDGDENSMTVYVEHINDQDRYVRSILSHVKPMRTLTADQTNATG